MNNNVYKRNNLFSAGAATFPSPSFIFLLIFNIICAAFS